MTTQAQCPVCLTRAVVEKTAEGGNDATCPRCGKFTLTDFGVIETANYSRDQRAKLSGWIREHQNCVLNRRDLLQISSMRTPTVGEKAEKAMLFLARMYPKPGAIIDTITWGTKADELIAASWCEDEEEMVYVLRAYLVKEKDFLFSQGDSFFKITPKGWAFMDSLRHGDPNSTIGFVAMWFDPSIEPVRTAIEAAVDKAGYKPLRIDQHQHNNRIDDEIVATIRRSKFIVADFTGQRGGVYFEAGFALGLGLQVIWVCKNEELASVHFDNRQYNFILWEADKLDALTIALQNRIEATIGRGPLK